MITPKDRQKFLSALHAMNIASDYPSLICVYNLLSLVVSSCGNNPSEIITTIRTERFREGLGLDRKFPIVSMLAAKLASSQTVDLCSVMYGHELHQDYVRFFAAFAPEMVANWYTLRQLDSEELPILEVLYWHFTTIAGKPDREVIFEKCYEDFYDQVQQHVPLLQSDEYEIIWDAINYHYCAEPDMQSHRVAKAVRLYAAQGKGKQELLEAYLLEQRDLSKKPICFSDLSEQERKKVAIEKIPSDDEVNFHTAPRYVNCELPDKAVANLYDYSRDISFGESVVAFDTFVSRLHTANVPLMINPNPHILNAWQLLSRENAALPKLSVAMPSRRIALALSRRYPHIGFYSIEELIAEPLTADLTDFANELFRKCGMRDDDLAALEDDLISEYIERKASGLYADIEDYRSCTCYLARRAYASSLLALGLRAIERQYSLGHDTGPIVDRRIFTSDVMNRRMHSLLSQKPLFNTLPANQYELEANQVMDLRGNSETLIVAPGASCIALDLANDEPGDFLDIDIMQNDNTLHELSISYRISYSDPVAEGDTYPEDINILHFYHQLYREQITEFSEWIKQYR